jgi:hypothetical protein
MCPHTAIYVSSYYDICVLVLLYDDICVLILLYVCPHATIYVSSYLFTGTLTIPSKWGHQYSRITRICVLILPYMYPHPTWHNFTRCWHALPAADNFTSCWHALNIAVLWGHLPSHLACYCTSLLILLGTTLLAADLLYQLLTSLLAADMLHQLLTCYPHSMYVCSSS